MTTNDMTNNPTKSEHILSYGFRGFLLYYTKVL